MGRSALSPSSLWQSHKRLSSLTPAWSGRSIHPYSTNSSRLSIFCPSVLPPPLKFAVESPARPLASLFILPSHVIRSRMENNRDQASRRRHLPIYTFGIVRIVIDNSEAPNRQMPFPRTLSLQAAVGLPPPRESRLCWWWSVLDVGEYARIFRRRNRDYPLPPSLLAVGRKKGMHSPTVASDRRRRHCVNSS